MRGGKTKSNRCYLHFVNRFLKYFYLIKYYMYVSISQFLTVLGIFIICILIYKKKNKFSFSLCFRIVSTISKLSILIICLRFNLCMHLNLALFVVTVKIKVAIVSSVSQFFSLLTPLVTFFHIDIQLKVGFHSKIICNSNLLLWINHNFSIFIDLLSLILLQWIVS